ncbi:MAG: citrate lyase subunit beta / citryl-CoA lyase [Gaiellaceae bacterium]|jgi:citrate lyase subunit beta/citryl-CoA lyase|nr:citrate lyase subunit beta / citryl-CoA lyase [Gaiellaceae bacterium]
MLAKAAGLPADQVFLDLEDAVAPGAKTDESRENVVRALLDNEWVAATLVVRVNSVDTPWCHQDLVYVVERAGARLDCIMVPKVEDASHVQFVDHLLTQLEALHGLERRIGIEAQIETARGIVNIERIAAASDRLETLIFGPGDYAASIGVPQLTVGMIEPDYPGDQWHYVLSRIVTTARAFGLQAIDGPFSAIRDIDGFCESARRSRLLGFDGKWALHPDQIGPCNATYTPSQEQYERAERVLDAYRHFTEVEGLGAAMFEGEMIDEASRKMAEALAARGRAAGLERAS